jgi:translation initiation factor 3 subunit E
MVLSPIKRKTALKDVLHEISSLSYLYSDPLTQFLHSLFDAFDFDIAHLKLQECSKLIKNDFFLQAHADKFLHEARMLITEMYCTVHHSVDLTMLAEKLNLSDEEAEKWMVEMVRGSSGATALNAKIDSYGKQVIIAPPQRLAHKQVVDLTKELTSRTGVLNHNLETLAKEQSYYIFRR